MLVWLHSQFYWQACIHCVNGGLHQWQPIPVHLPRALLCARTDRSTRRWNFVEMVFKFPFWVPLKTFIFKNDRWQVKFIELLLGSTVCAGWRARSPVNLCFFSAHFCESNNPASIVFPSPTSSARMAPLAATGYETQTMPLPLGGGFKSTVDRLTPRQVFPRCLKNDVGLTLVQSNGFDAVRMTACVW